MDLLILGASARAAAYSALRAGLRPSAIDLFSDLDLAWSAPCLRIARSRYPADFEALVAEFPPSPWIYTGALENHPALIDRLAAARPLWGNSGSILRAVRDPFLVADALNRASLPCPDVRRTADEVPRSGTWLLKPLSSAGGRRIERLMPCSIPPEQEGWVAGAESSTPRSSRHTTPARQDSRQSEPLARGIESHSEAYYLQQWIDGPSYSAAFVADRRAARLMGITKQWVGDCGWDTCPSGSFATEDEPFVSLPRCEGGLGWGVSAPGSHPSPSAPRQGARERPTSPRRLPEPRHAKGALGRFTYRGSIGPCPMTAAETDKVQQLGSALAASFDLVGLFGVDFIWSDNQPWSVEVNPRYTASVEVLELALGHWILGEHARACDASSQSPTPLTATGPQHGRRVVGKLILFASSAGEFPERIGRLVWPNRSAFAVRPVADIPQPGTSFDPGDPVMTLLASAQTTAQCVTRLRRRRDAWRQRLGFVT